MAYMDYYHCDVCKRKAFYDADLHYEHDKHVEYGCGAKLGYVADMKVICDLCASTHRVVVIQLEGNNDETSTR